MSQPVHAPDAGFTFSNHGSVCLCEPDTDEAYLHLAENVAADAQWWGHPLVVEPRYVNSLAASLVAAGFTVCQSTLENNMVTQRMSFGFICTGENFSAIQTRPTPEEQVVIDDYRERYKEAMGHEAHGFHYFPFPGVEETVCVWLPIEIPILFGKPSKPSAREDLTVEG